MHGSSAGMKILPQLKLYVEPQMQDGHRYI